MAVITDITVVFHTSMDVMMESLPLFEAPKPLTKDSVPDFEVKPDTTTKNMIRLVLQTEGSYFKDIAVLTMLISDTAGATDRSGGRQGLGMVFGLISFLIAAINLVMLVMNFFQNKEEKQGIMAMAFGKVKAKAKTDMWIIFGLTVGYTFLMWIVTIAVVAASDGAAGLVVFVFIYSIVLIGLGTFISVKLFKGRAVLIDQAWNTMMEKVNEGKFDRT